MHRKFTPPPCELELWVQNSLRDNAELFLVDIPFESFLCAMIIDDTSISTCRPGSGPMVNYTSAPRRIGAYHIQRDFYSGYFCGHGLKYQHILLPNGLFGSMWGQSISHNDVGISNLSGMEDFMFAVLEEDEHGLLPCGLADGIFGESAMIMTMNVRDGASEDEKRLYYRLKSIRQPIELIYGHFFNSFCLFKKEEPFHLFNKRELAYRTGIVAFFLLNCHTCMNGNVANSFFNTHSPTIQEYIPLDEELVDYVRH